MRRVFRHRPSTGTVLGLTALVVAIGGVAFAAIPDSGGTIHGCYSNSNGNLRIVESSAGCRSNENAISWNQQGPSGSPGEPGALGPTGPTGPRGERGASGPTG